MNRNGEKYVKWFGMHKFFENRNNRQHMLYVGRWRAKKRGGREYEIIIIENEDTRICSR